MSSLCLRHKLNSKCNENRRDTGIANRTAIEIGIEAEVIENDAHHVTTMAAIMPVAVNLREHAIQTSQKMLLKVVEAVLRMAKKRILTLSAPNVRSASEHQEDSWPIADAFIASSASKILVS